MPTDLKKNIYQAIIQKLAHVQSAVRSAQLPLNNGFVQEQTIIHRTIDETNEDIMFLVYAVTNDRITDLHKRFLEAFWAFHNRFWVGIPVFRPNGAAACSLRVREANSQRVMAQSPAGRRRVGHSGIDSLPTYN